MDDVDDVTQRIYPKIPQIGIGAVIKQSGRVLLIQRANEPGKGLWSIPGGVLELGETIRGAATREFIGLDHFY